MAGLPALPMAESFEPLDEELGELEAILAAEEMSPEALALREAEELKARVQALGTSLLADVEERITQRREVEARWSKDLRRYNAQYEPEEKERIESRKYGSRMFVPVTRRVCNTVEARLGDLLFPTEDRNFVVDSSPVPELSDAAELAGNANPDMPVDIGGAPVAAGAVKAAVASVIDEAKKRAGAMQRVVDDQLKQCDYPSAARAAIHDAIVLGTGVMKGPVVRAKVKKVWSAVGGVAQLVAKESFDPVVEYVDVWDFFPDMSATCMADSASNFQRHRMTKFELLRLCDQPEFDEEAVREFASGGAKESNDNTDAQRREASGTSGVRNERFTLYEFHGAVDAEDLEALGVIDKQEGEVSEDFYECVVFFTDAGVVLKAVINMMDTEEQPFSVFNWQRDTASVFGYGLSYELDDIQQSMNSSYRAAHDNMGLSVGPQIVIDRDAVVPQNGQYVIEPNKIWLKTDRAQNVAGAFGFFQIDSRLGELLQIFNLSKQLAEDMGGPQMAMQGQDAPNLMQTAMGASIAYSASNVWMRRGVKLFDDQITTPLIGRFVNWNMQYNEDPDIKGDFHIIARGTSALLAAEGQVQKIAQLTQMSASAGIPLRNVVAQLRAAARAMRLDDVDLLPDDEAVKAMEAAKAQQGPPPNPEMERLQTRKAELEDRAAERTHTMELATQANDIRRAELASKEGLTMAQLQAKYGLDKEKTVATLQDRQEQRAHDAQKFNAEIAVKQTAGSGI